MNKKERVFAAVNGEKVDRVPSAFWLHFRKEQFHGENAVKAHLDLFEKTDVDILKVMNENKLTCSCPFGKNIDNWKHIRPLSLKDTFVADQLEIIKRVVDSVGDQAVVIATIHGIVASASHMSGEHYADFRKILPAQLKEKPGIVADGLRIIAEGLAEFSRACLEAGAQGIYYAALGGESYLIGDEDFDRYIKPNDLMVIEASKSPDAFNSLHICKDHVSLKRYADYHPQVVNWGVYENNPTLLEGKKYFPDAVLLGGLDDNPGSAIVSGTDKEIEEEVQSLLNQIGTRKFILGADCTLPTDINYERIRTAVEATAKYTAE